MEEKVQNVDKDMTCEVVGYTQIYVQEGTSEHRPARQNTTWVAMVVSIAPLRSSCLRPLWYKFSPLQMLQTNVMWGQRRFLVFIIASLTHTDIALNKDNVELTNGLV